MAGRISSSGAPLSPDAAQHKPSDPGAVGSGSQRSSTKQAVAPALAGLDEPPKDRLSALPPELKLKIAEAVSQTDTMALRALANTSQTWREVVRRATPLELELVAATRAAVLDAGGIKVGKKKFSDRLRKACRAIFLNDFPIRNVKGQWLKYLDLPEQGKFFDRTRRDCMQDAHGFGIRLLDLGELAEQMPLLSPKQRERFFDAVYYICRARFRGEVLPGVLKEMAQFIESERRLLVALTIDMALHGGLPEGRHISLLSDLTEQTEHLSKASLRFILKKIEAIEDEAKKADAVSFLGPATPHLSEAERNDKFKILTSLRDSLRPIRVARFVARMPNLTADQCTDIVNIISGASDTPDIQADALSYLGPVLKHFGSGQCRSLFGLAERLPNPLFRARAMTGLGTGGMDSLAGTQRPMMILDAIANNSDADAKATEIVQVAPETKHLTDDEKTRLIEVAINLDDEMGRAGALGAVLKQSAYLSDDLLNSIFGAVPGCGDHMWLALKDAAPFMQHLGDELRRWMVDSIKALDKPKQSEVLENVGPAMPHLSAEDQRAFVDMARAIEDKNLRARALAGLERGLARN